MLRALCFLFLFSLAACGGSAVDDLLGRTLSIYSVDAPSSKQVKSEVSVTAKAVSSGDIADNDLEWIWDQKNGSDVSERSQEQVGHSSTFRFRAPASSGDIRFRVTVKGRGESDSEEFTIRIYD